MMRRSRCLLLLLLLGACVEGRLPVAPSQPQLSDATTLGPDCWLISPDITITYAAACPAAPVGNHDYTSPAGVAYKVLWNRH